MTRFLLPCAVLLLGAAFQISKMLDALPLTWDRKEALSVWSSGSLKRMFAGYENAVADIYWLRAIQYHGSQIAFNPESKLDLLESFLKITTDLDPRFEIAYRYGAVFLSEARFGANAPEAGIALLEKGLRAMPSNWHLAQDRAMFTSVYLQQHDLAAYRAAEAARMPGAPAYLNVLAITFRTNGDSRESKKAMWRTLTTASEEPFVRAAAQRYLDRYEALDIAEGLTKALVPRFINLVGRPPNSSEDFIAAGLIRAVPHDPTGTPFSFDAAEQRFRVNRNSYLYLEGL